MIGHSRIRRGLLPIETGWSSTFKFVVLCAIGAAGILALTSTPQQAFAATVTWDGNSDGDGNNTNWSDALNWDGDTAPTGTDDIVIDGNSSASSIVHLDTNFEVTTGSIVIDSGDELVIDPGVTLTVSNSAGTGIFIGGTLTNDGTIAVSSSGGSTGIDIDGGTLNNTGSGTIAVSSSGGSTGIRIQGTATLTNSGSGFIAMSSSDNSIAMLIFGGTLTNDGTIAVASTGTAGILISSFGTLNNTGSGTIIVSSADGSSGIVIISPGTLTNSGTIDVPDISAASFGINIDGGTLNNTGTINVSNTGGDGVSNSGTITNNGTLNVENSGTSSNSGIHNVDGGSLENTSEGTLNVASTDGNFGVFNDDSDTHFINSGNVTISNSGEEGDGILSSGSGNTMENSGTITISNSGQNNVGLHNHFGSTFTNSGTIVVSNEPNDFSTGILINDFTLNSETIIVTSGGRISNNDVFENDGTVENSGIISNRLSGTLNNDGEIINVDGGLVDNFGELNNGDFGTIENYGVLKNEVFIFSTGSINANFTNDGQVNNYAGAEIDNLGNIDNTLGSIFNECGGVYFGTAPIGNAVVNEICDTTPPDTQITGAFDGKNIKFKVPRNGIPTTTSTTAKFFFIGSDNQGIQKFQCSLDGGAWTDCVSGVTYTGLQNAITHNFKVRAVDLAGNVDPEPATFTWKINPPKLK